MRPSLRIPLSASPSTRLHTSFWMGPRTISRCNTSSLRHPPCLLWSSLSTRSPLTYLIHPAHLALAQPHQLSARLTVKLLIASQDRNNGSIIKVSASIRRWIPTSRCRVKTSTCSLLTMASSLVASVSLGSFLRRHHMSLAVLFFHLLSLILRAPPFPPLLLFPLLSWLWILPLADVT